MITTPELIDSDARTRLMLRFARGQRRNVPKGTVLFSRGTNPEGAYLVSEGRVNLSIDLLSGERLTPRLALPGETLGLDSIFSDRVCEFTARTAVRCRLEFVSRDELLEALYADPALFVAALQLLSRDIVGWYAAIRDSRAISRKVHGATSQHQHPAE